MVDFVIHRLKEANWISGFRFQKGRGYILDWTIGGRQRTVLLKEVIDRHDLATGARARNYTAATRAGDASWETALSPVECDFWNSSLGELGIGLEEFSLATLAKVVASWEEQKS